MEKILLNHHAGVVLPYYADEEGILHFIMEEKSEDYKPPYFDNGLNFIGGNWMAQDNSPRGTIDREVKEEFRRTPEALESLNSLLGGEKFLEREAEVQSHEDVAAVENIQHFGETISKMMRHCADYVVEVHPPIRKEVLRYGVSVFLKKLREYESDWMGEILAEYGGKLTTDNINRGSRIVSVTLDDINSQNKKFAWGYDIILNRVLFGDGGFLIGRNYEPGVIRTLSLVSVSPMELPKKKDSNPDEGPSYEEIEAAGYSYKKTR